MENGNRNNIIGNRNDLSVDENGVRFVLRLDTDRHARHAAKAYARSVRSANAEVAKDIMEQVHTAENVSRLSEHFLITGGAGSGKTRYLKEMVSLASQSNKQVLVVVDDIRDTNYWGQTSSNAVIVTREKPLDQLLRMDCDILVIDNVDNRHSEYSWRLAKEMAQRGVIVWIGYQGGYDSNGRRLDVHEDFVGSETAKRLAETGILSWTAILAPYYDEPRYLDLDSNIVAVSRS